MFSIESQRIYKIARSGMIKPNVVEVKSETKPIKGGRMAPPTIAVIISPESSFVFSGNLSIVMEKIRGKIFANPSPINKTLIITTVFIPVKRPKRDKTETSDVIKKKFSALIQFKITPPKNLPITRAVKKSPVPKSPNFSISIPNLDFKWTGMPYLILTSAPT